MLRKKPNKMLLRKKRNRKRRPKRTKKPKFLLTRFTTKEKKSSF
jgi:hypothetical protein